MENSGTMAYIKSGNDALTEVSANGICDLRRDVAKSEADIKQALGEGFCDTLRTIGTAECSIIKNDNDNTHRTSIQLNSIERDLQNQILTNRAVILKELGDKTDRVLDQQRQFERQTAENFCDVKMEGMKNTERILSQIAANKYDALKDELDETRLECRTKDHSHAFALQNQEINYLKQMIGSIEQTQKFSSKTAVFGAGNLVGTAQTGNQA